jgi:hypothetical protein
MAKGRGRDQGREAFWRRAIRGQRHSGLTVREFCRRSHLHESAFYFWRRELDLREAQRRRQHARRPRSPLLASPPAFVPVRLAASHSERVAREDTAGPAGRIEIELSGGHRVHVTAPVDRQALGDVLAVLATTSPTRPEVQPC